MLKAAATASWSRALTWLLFALFLAGLPFIARDWQSLSRFLVYAVAFVVFAFVVKALHLRFSSLVMIGV